MTRTRRSALSRVAAAAVTFRLVRYEIAEESMAPTLHPGDWAIGVRKPRRVSVGDVVVAEIRPGFEVVKRVVEGPPDTEGLWLLGDNPGAGSVDSRSFGALGPETVTARLLLRYHPRPMRTL